VEWIEHKYARQNKLESLETSLAGRTDELDALESSYKFDIDHHQRQVDTFDSMGFEYDRDYHLEEMARIRSDYQQQRDELQGRIDSIQPSLMA
jgi:hypothetical protein